MERMHSFNLHILINRSFAIMFECDKGIAFDEYTNWQERAGGLCGSYT